MHWQNDNELFSLMRNELYTAVVGDILDKMGYLHQFLPQKLQPLREDMVVAGRAMTVLEADCFDELSETGHNPILSQPFGLMLDALDSLKENDVYICSGSSPSYALWGELMSTRAMKCGAVGAVVDGFSRDTRGIYKLNFPTFSHGRYAQDQAPRGKVIDFNCPIEIGGIRIEPRRRHPARNRKRSHHRSLRKSHRRKNRSRKNRTRHVRPRSVRYLRYSLVPCGR